MEEPDTTDYYRGLERNAEKCVGPSAMMLEGGDGAVNRPEDVQVGGFGRDRYGDAGVGCLAVESGAGKADSGHQMSYGFHSKVEPLESQLVPGNGSRSRRQMTSWLPAIRYSGSELRSSLRYWLTPSMNQA